MKCRTLSLALVCAIACAPEEQLPREPEAVAVRTETVSLVSFQPSLTLLGSVRPSETIPIVTVTGGTISYPARFRAGLRGGEDVRQGEVLAFVENESARHTLAEARLVAESAQHTLDRSKAGFAAGLVSQSDLLRSEVEWKLANERLASAERLAHRRALVAPRGGKLIVTAMLPASTELAAGTVVAEVAAGGRPRVVAAAPSAVRDMLRPGLLARFVAPRAAGAIGSGTVSEVAPIVDESGTIRVVIDTTDARGLPTPGEGVEVTIALDPKPEAISVPDDALVIGSGGSAVFIAEEGGGSLRARRVAVEIGARGDGRVEIVRGLKPGDRVVVSGAAFLTDGARVVETEKEGGGART